MKKRIRTICLAVCISLIFTCVPFSAYAADTVEIGVDVTYGQTEARNMLPLINKFRTATDGSAWQWNSDDSTKTYFNTDSSNTLSPLTYDYELEKTAMQRAAEIAVIYSHTRPDGSACFTAYSNEIFYWSKGENIAYGWPSLSGSKVFELWQETDQKYAGQGHRRNMLNGNFNIIGIGHVKYDGADFWVQEFGKVDSPATEATTALDSLKRTSVSIDSGKMTVSSLDCATASITLNAGESKTLPEISAVCTVTGHSGMSGSCTVYPTVSWVSGNTSAATVTGNKVKGVSAGTSKLTASFADKSVSVTVTVKDGSQPARVPGDVNNDGKVTTMDATLVKRYVVGGYDIPVFNKANADVNGDGKITTMDATLIKRYVVGGYGIVLK